MKITRINSIKRYRVFDDFIWSQNLPAFARFNLIYGWNGSGKTTISNLFRHVERKVPVSEGEVEFQIDGHSCAGASLASASGLPKVRVFNREFVEANVFSSTLQIPENPLIVQVNIINPIVFLGQDSVEKQQQVVTLNKSKQEQEAKLDAKRKEESRVVKSLDDFCIREAKGIKELLSSSGQNSYNNYDKGAFRAVCTRFAALDPAPASLTDDDKVRLKQQKDAKPRDIIGLVDVSVTDFEEYRQKVETLLARTVVSQVVEELQRDPVVAEWVRQGLGHHAGKKRAETCRFCTSPLPSGRIEALEAHFNDEYTRFVDELDVALTDIAGVQTGLAEIAFPDQAKFYDHLVSSYMDAVGRFEHYTTVMAAYLRQLSAALSKKRSKPFVKMELTAFVAGATTPDTADAREAAAAVNATIARHNAESTDFQKLVIEARKRLEAGLAVEALPEFKNKTEAIRRIGNEAQKLRSAVSELQKTVVALERDIVEHRRPADELNAELRNYLGRDELRFELAGNGYQITRHGVSARHLSEGERTAIAFLYYLKSLQAKDFELQQGIVVVDDPVSSLDANAMFSAFGYMKDRTRKAGQLFILTHNFALFREVRRWFQHMKKEARFYMLETGWNAGKRNAVLMELDPLLRRYESEYHYLFKRVYDEANDSGAPRPLEEFYPMPNIARRLLESFLAFRLPCQSGQLRKQLDLVEFDPAKKARMLQLLHNYSHENKIGGAEDDLSFLAETPAVLNDVLQLISSQDREHFKEMVKLASAPEDGDVPGGRDDGLDKKPG